MKKNRQSGNASFRKNPSTRLTFPTASRRALVSASTGLLQKVESKTCHDDRFTYHEQ